MTENIYYDKETIWEMNNMTTIFDALVARYGQTKNIKTFERQFHEYLTDRGVKVYKGTKYTIYYRDNDDLYNKYKTWCEKNKFTPDTKDGFYEKYRHRLHDDLVTKNK